MRVFFLSCLFLAGLALAERKTYSGYQVVSVTPTNQAQLNALKALTLESRDDVLLMHEPALQHEAELVVSPHKMAAVFKTLKDSQLKVTLMSADVGAEMDAVMAENERQMQQATQYQYGKAVPHNFYRTVDQVNTVMEQWANDPLYAGLVVRKQMAYLSQQDARTVYYLEVGTQNDTKPVIFIEGLAHSREWVVTAALIYSIDTMLTGYLNGDQQAVDALNMYTWVIIPMVNPDGYAYTWTSDRMWRKNRKFISNQCSGVDLNRNYNVDFGAVGTSTNCREDTYHGGYAFSEAESLNVATLFDQLRPRVVSFLSVHAYSQLLLYPWGYVNSNVDPNPPSNIDQLMAVGGLMRDALNSDGVIYQLGTAFGVLGYAASGAAEDWALQEKSGIYAYCYELRPAFASQGGFDIPPSQIVPTGQELLRSLLVLAEQMPNY